MQQPSHESNHVLGDFCAICHVNAIKYTCPRCSIHTCSFPCVKKHKQRAQCSGVRDPAEYRKRSELATAASIDKDFNFITQVERSIQRADDTSFSRGIDLVPARHKSHHASNKSKIEIAADSRNIHIIRAPKGLSRSKINRTHWHGPSKCILWTIEWVDEQSNTRINNIHEFKTLAEAYISTFGKKALLKRKRSQTVADSEAQSSRDTKSTAEADTAECPQEDDDSSTVLVKAARVNHPAGNEKSAPDSSTPSNVALIGGVDLTEPVEVGRKSTNDTDTLIDGLHFYLLRPNTEARYKVLIPVASSQSLQDMVNDKTIVEFPTIYVLPTSPTDLDAPFLLEQEYDKRHGEDIPINLTTTTPGLVTVAEFEDGEIQDSGPDFPVDLNETKVLEVLAKDLSG